MTWAEYAANEGESSTPASRIQRARFVTTTDISSLAKDNYTTTVKLHNPYFNDVDDKFERNQHKEVTPPSNSVRTETTIVTETETTADFQVVWNFSDGLYDDIATRLSENNFNESVPGNNLLISGNKIITITTTTKVTKTVGEEVTVEEKTDTKIIETNNIEDSFLLNIANGTNTTGRKITSVSDGNERFFLTHREDNSFSISALTSINPDELENTVLKIKASPDGNTPVTPNITYDSGLSISNTSQTFSDKRTNSYEIKLNGDKNNNDKTITIKPTSTNRTIRFYQFELSGKYHKIATIVENFEETISSD